jgi:hypothetical protein
MTTETTPHTTNEEITQLKLAADAAHYSERAAAWKQVATALADALRISGWTQVSGGQHALESYSRLLRAESRTNLAAQP